MTKMFFTKTVNEARQKEESFKEIIKMILNMLLLSIKCSLTF